MQNVDFIGWQQWEEAQSQAPTYKDPKPPVVQPKLNIRLLFCAGTLTLGHRKW